MKRHARKAWTALNKIGAPVYHQDGYDGAHFVIGGELRHAEDRYFADYWQEEIIEELDDNGKVVNAFGVREDVWRILRSNDLTVEWINGGMAGVYDI